MKLLIAPFCLLFSAHSFGYEDLNQYQIPVTIYKTGETVNDSLSEDQSVYIFTFKGLQSLDSNAILSYSIDGFRAEKELSNGMFEIETTPGKHVFEFSVLTNQFGISYVQISSDSLEIVQKTEASYRVQLTAIQTIINVEVVDTIQAIEVIEINPVKIETVLCKPVIYLYPEEKIKTTVAVDVKGHSPFYYPEYENNWSVIAHPNGNVEMEEETYRYLFWESTDVDYLTNIEVNEGFVVDGSNALSFLEEKLSDIGLNASERADFITYWGPKIASNKQNLVRFEWNEKCDQFAELNITPKPDHIFRFYIFIAPLDVEIDILPQILPTMNRNGFVVLEWGGQLSNYQPNKTL